MPLSNGKIMIARWFIFFILLDLTTSITSSSPLTPLKLNTFISSPSFIWNCLRILSNTMWYAMIAKVLKMCQRNQTSINFKYEVLGMSALIAFSRVAITRRAVPAPMNRSLGFSMSMKRVEYPKSHKRLVGKNVFKSWLVNIRRIGMVNINWV